MSGISTVEKVDVKGPNTHPVFQFLLKAFPGNIAWNFDAKFVVDRVGVPIKRFKNEDWMILMTSLPKHFLRQRLGDVASWLLVWSHEGYCMNAT